MNVIYSYQISSTLVCTNTCSLHLLHSRNNSPAFPLKKHSIIPHMNDSTKRGQSVTVIDDFFFFHFLRLGMTTISRQFWHSAKKKIQAVLTFYFQFSILYVFPYTFKLCLDCGREWNKNDDNDMMWWHEIKMPFYYLSIL